MEIILPIHEPYDSTKKLVWWLGFIRIKSEHEKLTYLLNELSSIYNQFDFVFINQFNKLVLFNNYKYISIIYLM